MSKQNLERKKRKLLRFLYLSRVQKGTITLLALFTFIMFIQFPKVSAQDNDTSPTIENARLVSFETPDLLSQVNKPLLTPEPEKPKPVVIVVPAPKPIIPKPGTEKVGNVIQSSPVQKSVEPAAANVRFIWPVMNNRGEISRGLFPGHNGVDIWDNGAPFLVAIADGVVTSTGWENYGGGYVVRVKFNNGFSAQYAHSQGNFQVQKNQAVKQGQPLVSMGSTGNSTGMHVHIELYDPQGRVVNGLQYFRKS